MNSKKHNNDTAIIAMMIGRDKPVDVDDERIIGVELNNSVVGFDSTLVVEDEYRDDARDAWSVVSVEDDGWWIVVPEDNDVDWSMEVLGEDDLVVADDLEDTVDVLVGANDDWDVIVFDAETDGKSDVVVRGKDDISDVVTVANFVVVIVVVVVGPAHLLVLWRIAAGETIAVRSIVRVQ